MPNSPDPKTMAKTLRAELSARHQVELTHSQCLELVAHQHGLASWNVLSARVGSSDHGIVPWEASNATIPVLRVFSVEAALQFYVEFLGFRLDFGGPSGGGDTPYYGQVTRAGTTLHLTEVAYDPGPGATVMMWINGLERLREDLNARREQVRVWGPAVWAPEIEQAPWGARVLTIGDPFGNTLRFNEPDDPAARPELPSWGGPPEG